jgi:hypothetical protein
MTKTNNETFVTITNKAIYDKLEALEKNNSLQHSQIIQRLDVTNGRVKLGRWIGTTALALVIIIVGLFIEHIVQTGGIK